MLSRIATLVLILSACATSSEDLREARILDSLAEDSSLWERRDPELVRMKLRKMQRGPYEWMRGTAPLYWRDLLEPGAARAATAFGDLRSDRVLLLGDAHLENMGTFRASDGTMFVDWKEFEVTGFGPFTADVRRLAASFAVVAELGAPGDAVLAEDLARAIATRYADAIATLERGTAIDAMSTGMHPLFDAELATARSHGTRKQALDELAPIEGGIRVLAVGDLEPVAPDGVIENRVERVTDEQAAWIDRAVENWRPADPTAGAIKLRARRYGSGVASFPAYRFQAVLEGPTKALDDDVVLELEETREGIIVGGVPILHGAEWPSPAVRAVDTQRRLHARDGDRRLGTSNSGGLSLRIRDGEAYQRGIAYEALVDMAAADAALLRDLAGHYGWQLGRAHGNARTAEFLVGQTVIAPVLAGREAAFADEIAAHAASDAAQVFADFEAMSDRDLGAIVSAGTR